MTNKPKVLNPWEELAQVARPSIFMQDQYFRAKNPSNQIKTKEDLGYKQFGVFARANERQPNKHEGLIENAKTKAPRPPKGTIRTFVGRGVGKVQGDGRG